MATGDTQDITSRLQRLIPPGWFPVGLVPIRDAIITGAANAFSFIYSLLAYIRPQTRIGTATDVFLDLIAADFFGSKITRAAGQSDASFRTWILANLVRQRGTRQAVISILQQLTGRTPRVFEPRRPADTGCYGGPTLAYGVAGGYGSMLLPYQSFVTAFRPVNKGIPNIAGYGVPTGAYGRGSQAAYASLSSVEGNISDADIFSAVDSVRPVAYTIWMQIKS